MSIESDIELIKQQEQRLQFEKFDEADAWALGSLMRERALAKKLPIIIDIRIGTRPLFYAALPGTAADNADWARRKYNTVIKIQNSSYLVGLMHQARNLDFNTIRGLSTADYTASGGGFPIHIKGTGVVGAVVVSGVPQRDDHGFVVESIATFLKLPFSDIALLPNA